MTVQTIIIHPQAPAKPGVGQPCNGCGICCLAETCPVARLRFLRRHGPCPALEWHSGDSRYRCGLLARPAFYLPGLPRPGAGLAKRLLARWIAAGIGCDCDAQMES